MGFSDAKPHVNLKTFKKWLAEGRQVQRGMRSIAVKGPQVGVVLRPWGGSAFDPPAL